ncbi:TPA: hypothetical protein ACG05V_005409 [Bacillus pacificus]
MIKHPDDLTPNNVVVLKGDIQKIKENIADKNYLGSYEMFCSIKNKSWDITLHFKVAIHNNTDKRTKHQFPYDIEHSIEISSAVLEGEKMNTFLTPYALLEHHFSDQLDEIDEQFVYDSIYMLETNQ